MEDVDAREAPMPGEEIAPAEDNENPLAVLESHGSPLAAVLARSEIDAQVSTAKQYPRSIDKAIKKITTLAVLDEETATECMYALPRGNKPITGPSIRFAEIVCQSWGNARVDARVVHVDRDEGYVEAEGVYLDLEENVATRRRVRRRILDKHGRVYSDDMIIVTGNAACSVAARNSILAGVPKAVWRNAYAQARGVAAGDIETLGETREKAIKAFAQFGVTPERVLGALGVAGEVEVTIEHIPVLRGMYSALKNGEETVETMFDPRRATGKAFERVANPLSDEPKKNTETTAAASETSAVEGEGAHSSTGAAPNPRPAGEAQASPPAEQNGPKTAVEYVEYVKAFVAAAKSGDALQAKYASAAEKDLREKCGVSANVHDQLVEIVNYKATQLRNAKKGGGK